MKLETALNEYRLACIAEGLSTATIKQYVSLLSAFAWKFQGWELEAITPTWIRQYLVGLQERQARYVGAPQKPQQPGGLSRASVAAHDRALHAFWGWCSREYGISNPMVNIRRHKAPPPAPKALKPADFVRLFNAADSERDRAILVFLADTGCRLGGLLNLTLEGLYLEDRRALVREKGENTRSVVFTTFTAQLIRQWLAARQSPTDYVFCSLVTGKQLTDSGVAQILYRLKRRAGISGRCNPHSFRHNFAREYLRNGGDLATLAALMGHKTISTTAAYYAVFSPDELAEFHERYSPLRKIPL
jgi:site-specific recombinase XerD